LSGKKKAHKRTINLQLPRIFKSAGRADNQGCTNCNSTQLLVIYKHAI